MRRLELNWTPPGSDDSSVVVLDAHVVIAVAKTSGVPLFERCPPVHTAFLGRGCVQVGTERFATAGLAIGANTRHRLLGLDDEFAGVAYLDPRRYAFEDVHRLAASWERFVPGRDDVKELYQDTVALAQHRVDPRLLRALEMLESRGDVPAAAAAVDLSSSRLTHLMTEALGAPPRAWKAWFKLRAALGHVLFASANLTEAAHHAGFADSAHLTRTSRQLLGVRPAMMLPRTIYVPETALSERRG